MDRVEKLKKYINCFYQDNEFPALIEQIEQYQKTKPFENLKLLDATPVYRNTLSKYLPLLAGGAKLHAGVVANFPHDPKVVEMLDEFGVELLTEVTDESFDVVLDCAGCFATQPSKLGYVELTRSGAYRYSDCQQPVFLADSSRIKLIETVLGTGEGCLRALKELGFNNFTNTSAVVFGYGKVGKGVAMYLAQAGAKVIIVDEPNIEIAKGMSLVSRFDNLAIEQAVKGVDFVISVTGHQDAWVGMFDPKELINSGTVIANMGVEDEFGKAVPSKRVLNNKKPLNFILAEPTLLCYIEATMALHNAGAELLIEKQCCSGINLPDIELENKILDISIKNGVVGDEIRQWCL